MQYSCGLITQTYLHGSLSTIRYGSRRPFWTTAPKGRCPVEHGAESLHPSVWSLPSWGLLAQITACWFKSQPIGPNPSLLTQIPAWWALALIPALGQRSRRGQSPVEQWDFCSSVGLFVRSSRPLRPLFCPFDLKSAHWGPRVPPTIATFGWICNYFYHAPLCLSLLLLLSIYGRNHLKRCVGTKIVALPYSPRHCSYFLTMGRGLYLRCIQIFSSKRFL